MELHQKMSDLESKVVSTRQTLEQLIQKRNAVDPSMPLDQLERLTTEIRNYEKRLEDLQLLHIAIEKKLRQYDGKQGEAMKLRQEVADRYDEQRSLVEKMIKAQSDVAGYLEKIDVLNSEIGAREQKHHDLVGEDMNAPNRVKIYQAMAFAASNIQRIKPYPPWSYVSESEIAAKHKEEAEERRRVYEECAKKAELAAPACARCEGKTHLITTATPMGRGDGASWVFRCEKCGNEQNAFVPGTRPPRL